MSPSQAQPATVLQVHFLQRWFPLGFLLIFGSAITLSAVWLQPVWDDGWLALLGDGDGAIRANMQDRPLVGYLWQVLSDHGFLWSLSSIVHFAVWMGTAAVAVRVWNLMAIPSRPHALLVGCMAMAPVLCKTQLVIIALAFTSHIPVLLVYLAFLLVIGISATSGRRKRMFSQGLAAGMVLLGAQLSEYAIATAAACAVLLAWILSTRGRPFREVVASVALWLSWALLGYAIYWLTAETGARVEVRPEKVLADRGFIPTALSAGGALLNSLWSLAAGRVLAAISSFGMGMTSKAFALSLAAISVGGVFAWFSRSNGRPSIVNPGKELNTRTILVLLGACAAGCFPVVLMRPGIYWGMDTRFWLPVLPVAACLAAGLLERLVRRRYQWLLAFFVGYISIQSLAETVYSTALIRQQCRRCGLLLKGEISAEGLNVAVFVSDNPRWNELFDYELAARLSQVWPAEERKRFWAFSSPSQAQGVTGQTGWESGSPKTMESRIRGVERTGTISRIFVIRIDRTGAIQVQKYDPSM